MEYDRGDSFSFDFEPNGNPFGSNSKGKLHHDHIPFNLKGNGNVVFSVCLSVKKLTALLYRLKKVLTH